MEIDRHVVIDYLILCPGWMSKCSKTQGAKKSIFSHYPLGKLEPLHTTDKAPVSGHPREAEKVSATGAGRLRECVNTEFV